MHSELETRVEEYRSTLYVSMAVLIIGLLCLLAVFLLHERSVLTLILLLVGAVMIAVGGIMVIGIALRFRKKRLRFVQLTFRKSVWLFVIGIVLLCIRGFGLLEDDWKILSILGTVCTMEGFLWMCFQYRQYRDNKEVNIKKKEEDLL